MLMLNISRSIDRNSTCLLCTRHTITVRLAVGLAPLLLCLADQAV